MGRTPCCESMGMKKGPWTLEEDQILISYIQQFGHGNWRALPKQAGLLRCGKSCRLRWTNYLRPDIKRGNFSNDEDETIIKLHQLLGNRWSAIAAKLPGRTDNEIKNYWHTHLKKRQKPSFCTMEQSTLAETMIMASHHLRSDQSCSYVAPTSSAHHHSQQKEDSSTPTILPSLNLAAVSTKHPVVSTMENIVNNRTTNGNDDMDFWFQLLMKTAAAAGSSTDIHGKFGQFE